MPELQDCPDRIAFPAMEEDMMLHWKKHDCFKNQLKQSEGKPEYSFYDGPPFATGSPHYGHILAGTIKDVRTRFAHQTGFHVPRNFGWDCHGLPIEFEIEKILGIKTRDEVLELGIDKYNQHCRSIVMRCESEWKDVVPRMGRWIDFEGGYKTMDPAYMESVWWVFKSIFDKGLVYRGFKVMPYSMACSTPVSNFEKDLNYQDVSDPAVVVTFPLADDPATSFVAWTTTPWTLPSNLALCVNPDFDYVKIRENPVVAEDGTVESAGGAQYWLCAARTSQLYKDESQYTVLETVKGSALKGKTYTPLFEYFKDEYADTAFRVCTDGYVTDDSGTGIVHQAPAFGEDDMRVCVEHDIVKKGQPPPCPIDANGMFVAPVLDPEFTGLNVKKADPFIVKKLRAAGRLASESSYQHSYPFCWRSDTPLIYKAVPSWFVNVESFRDKLVKNNGQTYWVPESVRNIRFNKWLANANDWNVGRTRFWGTPMPLWANEDYSEMVAIGSVEELYKLSGVKVTDLHREFVDQITIPSQKGGPPLKRVEEVFDCWFESGSMPYGQAHYPFENKERFEKTFPADFIAEGLDQTRGWFYTLMVLSTALFDKPAFKNNIVNGIVKAEDGKKMSKRLKNYPDPRKVVNAHGADALRLYLVNSPVVRAQDLAFKEAGVKGVVRDVLLPWYNAYRFFIMSALRFKSETGKAFQPIADIATSATNQMDRWVLASLQTLIKTVHVEIGENYKLYNVVPPLISYLEQVTNWYLRLNRDRMKGTGGTQDWLASLSTCYTVLLNMCKAMASVTPFITDYMFQNLKLVAPVEENVDSVHYLMLPDPIEGASDPNIERAVATMQVVINEGRKVREQQKKSMKQPLKELTVVSADPQHLEDLKSLESYVISELNIGKVICAADDGTWSLNKLTPNFKVLGKKLGKDMPKVKNAVMSLPTEAIDAFVASGTMEVEGYTLTKDEVEVTKMFKGESATIKGSMAENGCLVLLNTELDEELVQRGLAREFVNRVQKMRKSGGLAAADKIEVFYQELPSDKPAGKGGNKKGSKGGKGGKGGKALEESTPTSVLLKLDKDIGDSLNTPPPTAMALMQSQAVIVAEDEVEVDDVKYKFALARQGLGFKQTKLLEACGGDAEVAQDVVQLLTTKKYQTVQQDAKAKNTLCVKLGMPGDDNEVTVNLTVGKEVFWSIAEASRA